MSATKSLFDQYVLPLARRTLVLAKGKGSYVWDEDGKQYLDFGGGIAVNALGHAHPEIVQTLTKQAGTLMHCSNLYFHEWGGRLAEALVKLYGSGKIFFSNSGAESNEALIKLSRLHGHDRGAYEVITTINSFHGRTMAGISATGQDKVKKGFEPLLPHFVHVPYNDLKAVESAITDKTVAVMIEGIQGEGGVYPATVEYLQGLRKLTQSKNLLLLWDGIQCGHFRSGRFQSYERILEGIDEGYRPDAVSMAKSLGAGYPMGAFWISDKHASLFQPGSHGSTYAGSPLACAIGLKVLEVIHREKLADNIRAQGDTLIKGLNELKAKHACIEAVRGYGGIVGLQLNVEATSVMPYFLKAGLIVAAAANRTVRYLPALNIASGQVTEALELTDKALVSLQAEAKG
jgi:acetylornithine aminotransferase/acetylornithine/N-succinyldiaminopimelate aminotransferase